MELERVTLLDRRRRVLRITSAQVGDSGDAICLWATECIEMPLNWITGERLVSLFCRNVVFHTHHGPVRVEHPVLAWNADDTLLLFSPPRLWVCFRVRSAVGDSRLHRTNGDVVFSVSLLTHDGRISTWTPGSRRRETRLGEADNDVNAWRALYVAEAIVGVPLRAPSPRHIFLTKRAIFIQVDIIRLSLRSPLKQESIPVFHQELAKYGLGDGETCGNIGTLKGNQIIDEVVNERVRIGCRRAADGSRVAR